MNNRTKAPLVHDGVYLLHCVHVEVKRSLVMGSLSTMDRLHLHIIDLRVASQETAGMSLAQGEDRLGFTRQHVSIPGFAHRSRSIVIRGLIPLLECMTFV